MLSYYRRHRKNCKGHHAHNTRSTEYDERKRGWTRCECPVFVSGTLGGIFKRQNTGEWEWPKARTVGEEWTTASSWEITPQAPPVPPPETEHATPSRITIEDAIKVYLISRQGMRITPPTLRKYKTLARQITAFAEAKGYIMLDQITPADIDVFYANWQLGARTQSRKLSLLKSFFRFCVNREWIPKTPVSSDIKPPVGANRIANKAPFTDQELGRIIAACERMPRTEWTTGTMSGTWSGEDVKDFVWMMMYTGLRISDVGLFNMSRLHGNEVFLRAKKNGGEVYAYLPDWLCDRLNARAQRLGPRPFIVGRSERVDTITDTWRRKINDAFALAGEFEEPPTPHRFRHTFARILLQRGVPVADVADLLGDDEKTVRTHYARWVPERQARLSGILKDAFADKPKPTLVKMPNRA
jgi:integrase